MKQTKLETVLKHEQTKNATRKKNTQNNYIAVKKEIVQKPNKTRQRSDKRKENDQQEKMKLMCFMLCLFCSLHTMQLHHSDSQN